MSETTAPALTAVPPLPRLTCVTPTATGPAAHPATGCPGCVALGTTRQSGDYSPRSDNDVTLAICLPGPHDPHRTEPLLLWAGDRSGARGVLPLSHQLGYHPYFTTIRDRFAALDLTPPPAAELRVLAPAA